MLTSALRVREFILTCDAVKDVLKIETGNFSSNLTSELPTKKYEKKVEGMKERRTRKIFMPHETFIIFFFSKKKKRRK